jgi:hypothetical protein
VAAWGAELRASERETEMMPDDLDSLAQFLPNCLQLAEGIFSVNFFGFFVWTGDVEGAIYCSTGMVLELIRSILLSFPVFVVVA